MANLSDTPQDEVQAFVDKRMSHHRKMSLMHFDLEVKWQNVELDEQSVRDLFPLLDGSKKEDIRKIENELILTGQLRIPNHPTTLPGRIEEEVAHEYVKSSIARLAEAARLEAIKHELIFIGYDSMKLSNSEIKSQVAVIMTISEEDLSLFEVQYFYFQEKIFTKELSHSEGEPKVCEPGLELRSGVYEVHRELNGVLFCHVHGEYFQFNPYMTFDVFELTYFNSGWTETTQTNSSRSDINLDMTNRHVAELLEKLTSTDLMRYKHEMVMSNTRIDTNSSNQRSAISTTPSSSAVSTKPSTSAASNHTSDSTVSTQSTQMVTLSTNDTLGRTSKTGLTDPSSYSSGSFEAMSTAAVGRHSRLPTRTVRPPRSDSIDLQEMNSHTFINKADGNVIFEIGVSSQAVTVENWRRLYDEFAEMLTITERRHREAAIIADEVTKHLMTLYKETHEVDHFFYIKNMHPVDLTDEEVVLFLFAIQLRKNYNVNSIIYELFADLIENKKNMNFR